MEAILTKFLDPAHTGGAPRTYATCESGSTTVSWDYSIGTEDNHRTAACKLVATLGWKPKDIHTGSLKDGSYVHVLEF